MGNPADVLAGTFLLLSLTFAHLSCCRVDSGWGVNEVICICPKLFAVDCFEGETAEEEKENCFLLRKAPNAAILEKYRLFCTKRKQI